jgi:hypothetical protein
MRERNRLLGKAKVWACVHEEPCSCVGGHGTSRNMSEGQACRHGDRAGVEGRGRQATRLRLSASALCLCVLLVCMTGLSLAGAMGGHRRGIAPLQGEYAGMKARTGMDKADSAIKEGAWVLGAHRRQDTRCRDGMRRCKQFTMSPWSPAVAAASAREKVSLWQLRCCGWPPP